MRSRRHAFVAAQVSGEPALRARTPGGRTIALVGVMGGMLLAGSLAAVTATASTVKPAPTPNPDDALRPAQRNVLYQGIEADVQHRYASWLASPAATGLDLRALPRRPMAGSYPPGQPDLASARQRADRIVLGTVSSVGFRPNGTLLQVQVDRTVKGQAGPAVLVFTGGGLFPDADFVHASLSIAESAPLLLPGDRAVLLLQDTGRVDGALEVQPFTGEYVSTAGRVTALPGNPFAADVAGRTEAQLLTQLAG